MKITHYICPRNCGKTTFAENSWKDDPSILLIERDSCVTDIDLFYNNIRGKIDSHNCYTQLIIDEFIPFSKQKGYSRSKFLYIFCSYMGIKDIILISTPDKLHHEVLDSKELYDKFLINDLFTTIIKDTFMLSKKSEKEKLRLEYNLGYERYLTDIEGEFLK